MRRSEAFLCPSSQTKSLACENPLFYDSEGDSHCAAPALTAFLLTHTTYLSSLRPGPGSCTDGNTLSSSMIQRTSACQLHFDHLRYRALSRHLRLQAPISGKGRYNAIMSYCPPVFDGKGRERGEVR